VFPLQQVRRRQSTNTRDAHRAPRDELSDDHTHLHTRRKRKVSNGEDGGVAVEDDSESAGQLKRRKRSMANLRTTTGAKPRRATTIGIPDDAEERDHSPSDGQKAGRENLTEEQKRNNHILSEQKRRNLIKQGFDDLCELVPDLKGGGYSKSAMLVQAADWLENMLKGNEELRAMLLSLNGAHHAM
jgi:hypothetical protein